MVTAFDRADQTVRPAEHRGGLFELSGRNCPPDRTRADGFVIQFKFGTGPEFKPVRLRIGGERLAPAAPAAPETPLFADTDAGKLDIGTRKEPFEELFRFEVGEFRGERLDPDQLGAGFAQEPDPFLQRNQQDRRFVRAQHGARMWVERHRGRNRSVCPRKAGHLGNDAAVTEVNSVEHADPERQLPPGSAFAGQPQVAGFGKFQQFVRHMFSGSGGKIPASPCIKINFSVY